MRRQRWTSGLVTTKSISIESAKRIFAGCASKVVELTSGDLPSVRLGELRRARAIQIGVSLEKMIKELSPYIKGWRGYFGFCQTRDVLEHLDGWIRRRLRSFLWTKWKNGRRRVDELVKLGLGKSHARKIASSPHGPWRLSISPPLHHALSNEYFDSLGLPRLIARG